jgi:hypothetical protein
MKASVWLGILLIVGGILSLVFGGIRYTKEHSVLDVGPIHARAEEKKTVPIPPLVGGLALAAGLVLVISGSRGGRTV